MFNELRDIICEFVEVNPEEITEDSRFIEDLGFNSYDFMCMVGQVEDTFEIEVLERDIINIKTVKNAIEYITSMGE